MNQQKPLLLLLVALLPLLFQAQFPNNISQEKFSDQSSEWSISDPMRQLQSCETNRVLIDGKCKCETPRILKENECECPWFMSENPTTKICEYIDLLDVAYQPKISPLFDAILQVQMNPLLKWAIPPTFTWTVICNYENTDTQDQLTTYLSTQQNDLLRIPSNFLEHNIKCNVKVSYENQNSIEISKEFSFKTFSYFQPQVRIIGGAFQMLNHAQTNSILADVVSLTGSPIFPSDLKITWTQTSGEKLNIKNLLSSSDPLRLTIPKCTLSQGKIYKLKVIVQIGANPISTTQEVTIGVYAPKIKLKPIETDSYHLYTKDLKLTASQFLVEDKCNQGVLPADILDLSTSMYSWECMIVDLEYRDSRLLSVSSEPTDITGDSNVLTHPDPQHIFYRSTSSKIITIPKSYFTHYKQYQFIFYLTATVQGTTPTPSLNNFNLLQPTLYTAQTKAYVQILASKPFTDLSLNCLNENNCQSLSDERTRFFGLDYNSKYTYTWIINVFSGAQVNTIYKNWITIFAINEDTTKKEIPQIILQVTDGKNVASSFFSIPQSTPIKTGSLIAFPSEGESYNTNFFIQTYLSKDEDLPITYQFYSSCSGALANYMLEKYEPYDETPLILPPDWGSCNVGVTLTDAFGFSNMIETGVPLTGRCTSFSEALERNYLAMDSTRYSSNLYQRMRLIRVILENLQSWETSYPEETSLNVTSAQFKYSTILELRNIFIALSPRDDLNSIMLKNIQWASEQLFNEDRNWGLYMDILDTSFHADSATTLLTPAEYNIFNLILDNLIYYMKKPENLIVNPEKVFTYVNTYTRSALVNIFPSDDDGFYYEGSFMANFFMKLTYCQVLEVETRIPFYYGLSANFTIKSGKTIPPEKCGDQVDFIFFAFRKNYIMKMWNDPKTLIFVDIRDSITGESLLDMYGFFLYSPVSYCPDGAGLCIKDPDGGTTIYGVFDLKDQIYKIFGKSKIDQVANISALADFKFFQSVAFWTVVAFSVWFLISFYLLDVRHPTYCALTAKKITSQNPLYQKINFFFWLVHPLIGIYLYNDPKTSKSTRLAMYYQRLVVVMVFSTIFSSISTGEGAVFRAYIILFNAVTVIPINSLFSRTFGWAIQLKISKKKFVSFLKQFIVFLLYVAFLITCFLIIFIIEAQQDESQNKAWAINFAISFVQDLTLAPLISITIKVLLVKSSQSKKTVKFKRTRTAITFLLQNFKFIYDSIFQNNPTPNETQSPTPTEIASPLSTSRKLLRLSTLDSPTLPRSPAKLVFKTRRVSDTEMGNVDSVAVETLVTDRFQTLFSEGKTERVKPLSPVKQNFERMQSANIASKFSTSSRFASIENPRGLRVNSERKLVNLTSIVLSPLDPFSESVEIEPENEVFSPDGSPLEGKRNLRKKEETSKRCETVI